ncbi:hypothetical protein [Delftia acidovorans]|uniref:hypothetical protein n=1 Tax=Delftia acidovorans TaxID=80866 RepID=UPI002FDD4608
MAHGVDDLDQVAACIAAQGGAAAQGVDAAWVASVGVCSMICSGVPSAMTVAMMLKRASQW